MLINDVNSGSVSELRLLDVDHMGPGQTQTFRATTRQNK